MQYCRCPAIPIGNNLFIYVEAIQEDHVNSPAISVGGLRCNSYPFAGDLGSEELLRLVAEGLAAFRAIDPGQVHLGAGCPR